MPAYLQMGHDSENLVGIPGLENFAGVILSPVNRSQIELRERIPQFRRDGPLDIILDPQLYCPQIDRGQLPNHCYFPQDLETADLSSSRWWANVAKSLAVEAKDLQVDAVCAPVVLPKKYSPEYYAQCSETYGTLVAELAGSRIRPVATVCVSLKELAEPNEVMRIASTMTSHQPKWAYIVAESEIEPRRELTDPTCLTALMLLVSVLEKTGCKTLVSHCSSEMILMKAAGATGCASGKFFNLRRFTRSRFDEQEEGGGGQLPYWFEHNLLGFLRRADIARLQRDGFATFLGGEQSENLFGKQIFEQFQTDPSKAWIALSWRQYLAWFAGTENLLSSQDAMSLVSQWLRGAEDRWVQLEDNDVLLEEPRNNGRWLRHWRQALGDFKRANS